VGVNVYDDIKYFNSSRLPPLILNDILSVHIHPLSLLDEIEIFNLFQKLNIQNIDIENDLKNKEKAQIIIQMCSLLIRDRAIEKDLKPDEELKCFEYIITNIVKPIIDFFADADVKAILEDNSNKSDKTDNKSPYNVFGLINLITNVLSRLSIPSNMEERLGLRFFLLAYKFLELKTDSDLLKLVPLLSETGCISNSYMNWKNRPPAWQEVFNNYNRKYKFQEVMNEVKSMAASGIASIMAIVNEVEKCGKSMSNAEYTAIRMKEMYPDNNNNDIDINKINEINSNN
jgi:hypothetical protein